MAEGTGQLRILVVEDSYLFAEGLRELLERAGMQIVGPAATLQSALDLLQARPGLEGAIVDLDLNGEASLPILDRLIERAVPILLMTGHDVSMLPKRYRKVASCQKPTPFALILQKLRALIDTTDAPPAK